MTKVIGVELKRCPFCGCKEPRLTFQSIYGHTERYIVCTNCGATGPSDLGESGAAEMWNLRREKMPNEVAP